MLKRAAAIAMLFAAGLAVSGCRLDSVLITDGATGALIYSGSSSTQQCSTSVAPSVTPTVNVRCDYSGFVSYSSTAGLQCSADLPVACLVSLFLDPLILQLPAAATDFEGTFDDGVELRGPLRITSGLTSIAADVSQAITAEPGMQLVIVDFPAPEAVPMNRRYSFTFSYRGPRSPVKVMFAGKYSAGGRTFYPPMFPCTNDFASVAALTLPSGSGLVDFAGAMAAAQGCSSKIYQFPSGGGVVAEAVEYYHTQFDHYFVTAIPGEIVALDAGRIAGWTPTGQRFNVYGDAPSGSASVCRFFSTSFGDKSSHFYSSDAGECDAVRANRDWSFEGNVFNVTPAPASGVCGAGLVPVYRLYNDGQGGAPNHRYTTNSDVRDTMIAARWRPEGYGPLGVAFCAPA